jgi:hypothetical protein
MERAHIDVVGLQQMADDLEAASDQDSENEPAPATVVCTLLPSGANGGLNTVKGFAV